MQIDFFPPKTNQTEAQWSFNGIFIPAEVLFNKDLSNTEKLLFGLIKSLSSSSRGCWASNRWLGEMLDVGVSTISASISNLHSLHYLKVEIHPKSISDRERRIFINDDYIRQYKKIILAVNDNPNPLPKNRKTPTKKLEDPYQKIGTDKTNRDKTNNEAFKLHSPNLRLESDTEKPEFQFLPIAKKLASIIRTKKRISITQGKLNAWCLPIMRLCKTDSISVDRIEKALEWYNNHIGEDFVPVIESGTSLRNKFTKLESAMKRDVKPSRTPIPEETPPVKKYKTRIGPIERDY